jgi:hypothetical protein
MLVRCVYASRAVEGADENVLGGILEQSRRNNLRCGITGLLIHANGVFVQALEGGREEVSRLLARLMRDDRHTGVTLLEFAEVTERGYANWTMGQVDLNAVNPAMVLKYSPHARLDPFSMTGHATAVFLSDIAASGAIVQR